MAMLKSIFLGVILALSLSLTAACGSDSKSDGDPDVAADVSSPADVAAETGADLEPAEDLAVEVEPDIEPLEGTLLTIVHINDLHSHLIGFGPESDYTPETTDDDGTVGGIARLATAVQAVRDEVGEDNLLALDAGDFTQGTLFSLVAGTEGIELALLDMLGFAATTLGNHEFDWGPEGGAAIAAAGTDGTSIHILSSNIVTDDEDPADDDFEALLEDGTVERELHNEMPNGLKVGLFGLMGEGAYDDAPFMGPLTVSDLQVAAQEATDSLREQGADIVVAVSHAGVFVGEGKYEDEHLAEDVEGLDVIVSGHSHDLLVEPEGDEDTIVVQAGNYGQYLGRLDLLIKDDGKIEMVGHELIKIDDSIPGDPAIQAAVLELVEDVNLLLDDVDLQYDTVLAETSFDLVQTKIEETALGNLLTDAVYTETNKVLADIGEPTVAAVFEANGLIRDSILMGDSGLVQLADAFRVLPLGIGGDGIPGYPISRFWVTAKDLKAACEAVLLIPEFAGEAGNTYFLQFAGMKFTYDPEKKITERVMGIYLMEDGEYAAESIDLSDDNPTLYAVATNYYVAAMISTLKGVSLGMLEVIPRDADGNPVENMATTIFDADPATPGLQELKPWLQLAEYMMSFEDTDSDGIPDMPEKYSAPEGRFVPVE